MRKTGVLLLLFLGVLAVPASAAPASTVVLRGSRAAYAEVTFPARFRPEVGINDLPDVAVVTKGTYAGAWFEGMSPAALGAGVVVVPAMNGVGGPVPVGWGSADRDDFSLPAGRYRVHLITDGPSEVRVRVRGLARDLSLAPRAATPATARLVEVGVPAGAAGRASIPVNVRSSTTTLLLASTDADWGLANEVSICIDEEPGEPCDVHGPGVRFVAGGVGSRSSAVAAFFVMPGDIPNGEHEATYTVATTGVSRGLWAFALSLR